MADAVRTTYSEKLLDPRWQRVRLEVLNKHDFRCWHCGSRDKTLHVHHRFYRRGAEPWDYDPNSELMALCKDCHATAELRLDTLRDLLLKTDAVDEVIGLLKAQLYDYTGTECSIENREEADGFGGHFLLSAEGVIDKLGAGGIARIGAFETRCERYKKHMSAES